jgi:hypothetical protein
MALDEPGAHIGEELMVQMVDCTVPDAPVETVPVPVAPESTPIQEAMDATLEQTGSGPPPEGA